MSILLRKCCGAILAVVLTIGSVAADVDEAKKTLDIYCIDISASVGNATLIVSPSGETMMLDAGPPRSETRTPQSMGDYYYGLSACPKSEVFGLSPRVAILSLGNLGHRVGTSDAMETVRSCPSVEDVWQTEFIREGGEKGHNSPEDYCANLGGQQERTRFIKISARPDGSFTVMNSRNGFTKEYPARVK